jgi:hypothetical protein
VGGQSAGQYDSSTTGTVNMTHTLGGTDDWLSGGFRVLVASAGGVNLNALIGEPITGSSVLN